MKHLRWQLVLGSSLIALSALLYFLHYAIFRDSHHIFIYLIGDIAFVPFEVLLVTLIIHRLLDVREKRSRFEKLNMVIGVFFSEIGTKLLTYFSDFDPNLEKIRNDFLFKDTWTDREFSNAGKKLKSYDYTVDMGRVSLNDLRQFLLGKRNFLLRLLENPNLLEHETFTNLLQAVFHMTEELVCREDINRLPESDVQHLAGDIKRSYGLLVMEWLNYMKHLRFNYPYLFSLALRTNPFDLTASPIVK